MVNIDVVAKSTDYIEESKRRNIGTIQKNIN